MPRNLLPSLSARTTFARRAPTAGQRSVLRFDAAILTAIVLGCTVVGISALLTDVHLQKAVLVGAFIAVQTVVFVCDCTPHLAAAVLVTGYIAIAVNRWDVTLALSMLTLTIAVANHIRNT